MPISKTHRQEPTFSNPTAQVFEDVDGEDKKQVNDDRVAELEKALRELQERQAEERSDIQLSQPTNWQSQVTDKGYTEVNPNTITLPDPALDPDGYANAVQRRAELSVENRERKAAAERRFENDLDTKTADLWDDFGAAYPDISDDRERVDFVATKVVKAAVKKGLDINRYMFGSGRNRFMKDVAKEYTNIFGEPEIDNDEDYEDNPRSRRRQAGSSSRNRNANRSRSSDDEGRSAGIFGGDESGGRANRREVEDTTSTMLEDLQKEQRKSGFF